MINTRKGVKVPQLTKHVSDYFYNDETVYEQLLTRSIHGIYREYFNSRLIDLPFFNSYYTQYSQIYIKNNDHTLTLIWSNGELVQ